MRTMMEGSDLPKGWRRVRLGDVLVDVQSGFACGRKRSTPGLRHLRMDNIGPDGSADLSRVTYVDYDPEKARKYRLSKGDVLFNNTNSAELVGKSALFDVEDGDYFYSNHLTRLRVRPSVLTSGWLLLCLRQLWHDRHFERTCNRWIGQAAVNAQKLRETEIPLPPLEEQRRIVGRIEELAQRIEEAKGLRRAARQEAEALLPAALAQTVASARGRFPARPLGELVRLTGGGTPSTKEPSYWSGTVPWVSPKDMKSWEVADSEERITEEAVSRSAVRWIEPGAVLVVVRGMILAKALPVAIGRARLTVNQDMKALRPRDGLTPDFLAYMLKGSEQDLLGKVETAAHGTRRLRTEVLTSLPIPVPPLDEQRRIVAYLDGLQAKAQALLRLQGETQQELEALLPSVLDSAFRGEL